MSQSGEPVKPFIDHAYWFDYSRKLIDGAQSRREAAAAAIQKLVIWLWGIYTASAAIGFSLSGKELSFWPAIIIAAASGALILVYWGTVWVQVPVTHGFDPRSPTEIEAAYNSAVKTKSFRLSVTLFGSVVAAIMVSLALMVASVSKPVKNDYSDITTSTEEQNGKRFLSITGWVGETDKVLVTVAPLLLDNEKSDAVQASIIPSKEGLLQTSVQIPGALAEDAVVELSWTSKHGTDLRVRKTVN